MLSLSLALSIFGCFIGVVNFVFGIYNFLKSRDLESRIIPETSATMRTEDRVKQIYRGYSDEKPANKDNLTDDEDYSDEAIEGFGFYDNQGI